MQPTQLMDNMLALLPNGEQPVILFKPVFLAQLPGDMRDHVQVHAAKLECPNLPALADNIWRSRVARKPGAMAAITSIQNAVATNSARKGVKPERVHKTAICTPFGLFEFIRVPFGLPNTGQTFQRLMNEILCGLPFVFVYLDDMLIASRTHKEHVQHLQQVLTIFKQHGLILNCKKCVLWASTVDYLGHMVTAEGISPLPDCVAAIN